MKKIEANDAEAQSADIVADNLSQLQSLFPEAFAEGKVQFDTLRQLLGGAVDEADEKYGLNWHGKRRARQIALTPSTGTLRPCPDESVDWDTTQNLMIEGDNLEVLKLLQKSYAGKVKLIYIDPPYNTGKDFVYPDNFRDSIGNYLELTGQVEGGAKLTANTDASGRFHTDWLNMMFPRLKLARSLLRSDGVLFVSIGDHELNRLRTILDEVFGEENFVANLCWQKKQSPQNDAINISDMHDHIVVYARQAKRDKNDTQGWQRNKIARGASQEARYDNKDNDERGDWTSGDLTCNKTSEERPNLYYGIPNPITRQEVLPSKTRVWAYERPVMERMLAEKRIWWGKDGTNMPRLKIFRCDVDDGVVPSTWWDREFAGDNQDGRRELRALFPEADVFDTPKPTQLLKRILEVATSPNGNDLVLDFFAGSGTTGHSVYAANAADGGNRRFILVQLPEQVSVGGFLSISRITAERLRRGGDIVKQSNPLFSGDVGFRFFTLDKSNIRVWSPDPESIAQSLLDHHEHVLAGRTEADIVYELLLKLGLDLCVPIESRKVADKTIGAVGGGVLMLCLPEKILASEVEAVAAGIVSWHKELAPAGDSTVVFRDSAFADDVAKTNMAAILAQNGLENVRSL
jgi:adenine-specific DNA-methyltransferase